MGFLHHFLRAEATIHGLDDNKCYWSEKSMTREPGNIRVARKTELTYNCLETGVQLCQEWGLILQGQHSFLNHGALHIIILDHHVFFQDFDCIELLCALPVCQHHLQDRQTAE